MPTKKTYTSSADSSSGKFKERPILFNDQMVRAILDGRKTQTRRVVKLKRGQEIEHGAVFSAKDPFMAVWPYGTVGDRLWVREASFPDWPKQFSYYEWTWAETPEEYRAPKYCAYRADQQPGLDAIVPWKPSTTMPRWASRITLEITEVRVERLQDISEEDVKAEGVNDTQGWQLHDLKTGESRPYTARDHFSGLWDSIYEDRAPWDSNPWVWVIEFKRAA